MFSPLSHLTNSVDLREFSRQHVLALNGHLGHGRKLSQSINFKEENNQLVGTKTGWGMINE